MLTKQEQAVVTCLEAGLGNKEIQQALNLNKNQVAGCVWRLRKKGYPKTQKKRPQGGECQWITADLPKHMRLRWREIEGMKCRLPVFRRNCCIAHFKKGYSA